MPGTAIAEYRVKARNTSLHGENAIHDDAVAQQYGFRGGLVPGVTVYSYMTHPLVRDFGTAWLERGTATVRFLQPVIENEEMITTGSVTSRDAAGIGLSLTGFTAATPECATMTATVPAGRPTPVNLNLYSRAPLPDPRPAATRDHLQSLTALGTPVTVYDEACAADYLAGVNDPLPLYRGPDGWVHPGFYLNQANRAIDRNVKMGPWIHVGSVIRHLGPARMGDTLSTLGRVRSLFDKKGREFVEVDLVIVAARGTRAAHPVAHILHTAIYRLPPPAPR
jgi:acyl dehydratase